MCEHSLNVAQASRLCGVAGEEWHRRDACATGKPRHTFDLSRFLESRATKTLESRGLQGAARPLHEHKNIFAPRIPGYS